MARIFRENWNWFKILNKFGEWFMIYNNNLIGYLYWYF